MQRKQQALFGMSTRIVPIQPGSALVLRKAYRLSFARSASTQFKAITDGEVSKLTQRHLAYDAVGPAIPPNLAAALTASMSSHECPRE